MTIDNIIAPGTSPRSLAAATASPKAPPLTAMATSTFGRPKRLDPFLGSRQTARPVRRRQHRRHRHDADAEGELYVCEGAAHRIVAFDVQTKTKRVLCSQIDGRHFNKPNDLAIDFWRILLLRSQLPASRPADRNEAGRLLLLAARPGRASLDHLLQAQRRPALGRRSNALRGRRPRPGHL